MTPAPVPLKPCPFCGNKRLFVHDENEDENAFVMCKTESCGARMYPPSMKELIKAWNRRKP